MREPDHLQLTAESHSDESRERPFATLADLLAARARDYGARCAYRYLYAGDTETSVTFAELDRSARAIAELILESADPGGRVLLVFPPGLEFIKAFFGCAYAGVLAVPATYPKPRRPSSRLAGIAEDSNPALVLTNDRTLNLLDVTRLSASLRQLKWVASDLVDMSLADQWRRPEISGAHVAFLQYTSGSTSEPKGVAVTHANILHNMEMIRFGFGLEPASSDCEGSIGVSWLPAYHDMGLIGGMLEAVYVGGCSVLMPPLAFLQRPERWLRAISEFRAAVSGAPNFAFELCTRRITPSQLADIDLSSWRVAFCGAEPVRAETLRRFSEKFAPCGFDEAAFYPCYGLAEATLLVSGGVGPSRPEVIHVNRSSLNQRGVVELAPGDNGDCLEYVSCGGVLPHEEIAIVDPHNRTCCPQGHVGEIWIRGGNVAAGYWGPMDGADDTFRGQLASVVDGAYLRSGDLGFLHNDCLYVTGRRKELLVFRGCNYYPHDLEATLQRSHTGLPPGGGAAFSVPVSGEERLVLVQEVDRASRHLNLDAMIRGIRGLVVEEHDLHVHQVILIRQGTLPRTTSGKVQRDLVREQFLSGQLKSLASWVSLESCRQKGDGQDDKQADLSRTRSVSIDRTTACTSRDRDRLAIQIENRLMEWLCEQGAATDDELDPHRPFAEYGVDSMAAVELSCELEEWLKLRLSPTVAWKYPTPAALATYLAEEAAKQDARLATDEKESDAAPESSPEDSFEQLLARIESMEESEATDLTGGAVGEKGI